MIIDNSYLAENNPDTLKKIIFAMNQELLALEKINVQLKERILILNFQIARNVDPELFAQEVPPPQPKAPIKEPTDE